MYILRGSVHDRVAVLLSEGGRPTALWDQVDGSQAMLIAGQRGHDVRLHHGIRQLNVGGC